MAPLDYDDYLKYDRAVYYDYNSICPTPPCKNGEIIKSIKLLSREQGPNRYHKYKEIS